MICEYDALPGTDGIIRHTCGHNLIAEAGVAAGLGLKAALESCQGRIKGRVTVLGTPAEESGGGKILLIRNHAFDDVDVAMMVHPAPLNILFAPFLASCGYHVTYNGKPAHASAFPWEGVNALDAAVVAYNSISVLRQQMKPSHRVHGVITEGGVRSNIIPDKAVMHYGIRAPTVTERDQLVKKIEACFQAGAEATGCEVKIELKGNPYDDVVTNPVLANRFAENMPDIEWAKDTTSAASTDMGNVSYKVPSIHPVFSIGNGGVANHTDKFHEASNERDAHDATLLFAKGLALTGLDVLTVPELLEQIRAAFTPSKRNESTVAGNVFICT